jgi:hypothetical protein|tara:strand:- start:31 stop:285 length:255 start_codon:yes stop_codon:yes gene_type:complete
VSDEVKVWGIIEGPISREDMPERDELPEDFAYLLVCKVEVDKKVDEHNFWFDSLDGAYEWKKYFDSNIEPLELEGEYPQGVYDD